MAVIVSDAFQRRGVGARLMEEMIAFAKTEKLERIVGTVLFENRPMRKLFELMGSQSGRGRTENTAGAPKTNRPYNSVSIQKP